jgi:hypothetical protein
MEMKIKTGVLREPAGYGSWQQIRASDIPDSQEPPDNPEMAVVLECVPASRTQCRAPWQQVRATDETESATS